MSALTFRPHPTLSPETPRAWFAEHGIRVIEDQRHVEFEPEPPPSHPRKLAATVGEIEVHLDTGTVTVFAFRGLRDRDRALLYGAAADALTVREGDWSDEYRDHRGGHACQALVTLWPVDDVAELLAAEVLLGAEEMAR